MLTQSVQLSKKPHVVIATPGRIVDHLLSSESVKMNRIRYLVRTRSPHLLPLTVLQVLDEADRLLNTPSLREKLKELLPHLPIATRRHTLLFSATLTLEPSTLPGLLKENQLPWTYSYTDG